MLSENSGLQELIKEIKLKVNLLKKVPDSKAYRKELRSLSKECKSFGKDSKQCSDEGLSSLQNKFDSILQKLNENEEIKKISGMTRLNDVPITYPNQQVFSYNTTYPVYRSRFGTLFNADTGTQTSIGNNNYFVYELDVPPNKGKTVYIDRLKAGSSSSAAVDIIKNATISTAVTTAAATVVNRNWNSANTSIVSCKYANTGSSTDPTQGGSLVGTFYTNNSTIDREYDGRLIIASSTTTLQLYVRFQNLATGNSSGAINVSWWEE